MFAWMFRNPRRTRAGVSPARWGGPFPGQAQVIRQWPGEAELGMGGDDDPYRMLIFSERHLRTILAQYESHYNGRRPHRSRQLRPPRPDHPVADLSKERIQRRPVLGGLINEYERAA